MKQDFQPLAARMRPNALTDFIGQTHLISEGKPLFNAIVNQQLHSMILWGPPGTGKTTLAKLMAHASQADLIELSAVMSGVKEVREAVKHAQLLKEASNRRTILFIDEIHRFNKAQQDAFLPYVEDGTIILIGATTENPSFELNSALLSRARVYVLHRLTESDLLKVISNALQYDSILSSGEIEFPETCQRLLTVAADGDARSCLNLLEIIIEFAISKNISVIEQSLLEEVMTDSRRIFDKHGEAFYDQISALHKSVRGSDPDAALYWLCRMLDGGCDPLYIARRVVRMASEDIGNADPRALTLALNAWDVQERLGSPEGELAIAQAVVYMAVAAKSNAIYTAFKRSMQAVKEFGSLPVPMHIRNAPTRLMKSLGYGKNYRYAHDEADAYARGENYFPENMPKQTFYEPVSRGLEIKIKEKLARLKQLDKQTG